MRPLKSTLWCGWGAVRRRNERTQQPVKVARSLGRYYGTAEPWIIGCFPLLDPTSRPWKNHQQPEWVEGRRVSDRLTPPTSVNCTI